jgi:type II secretory pathway pseudopilin PulG
MKKIQSSNGFAAVEIILVLVIVALIGVVGYVVYDANSDANTTSKEVSKNSAAEPVLSAPAASDQKRSYQSESVVSGKKRFTIEVPKGWGELLRPTDGDQLLSANGTKQPVYDPNGQVKVTDLEFFGSDSQRVLTVLVHDNIADPEGAASEFTLPNNGKPIAGKKYSLTYTDTTDDGLGGHKKGEKRYEYWFKLKDGNNLVVWYSVYAEDLTDQSKLVDEVVRSIVIKN